MSGRFAVARLRIAFTGSASQLEVFSALSSLTRAPFVTIPSNLVLGSDEFQPVRLPIRSQAEAFFLTAFASGCS